MKDVQDSNPENENLGERNLRKWRYIMFMNWKTIPRCPFFPTWSIKSTHFLSKSQNYLYNLTNWFQNLHFPIKKLELKQFWETWRTRTIWFQIQATVLKTLWNWLKHRHTDHTHMANRFSRKAQKQFSGERIAFFKRWYWNNWIAI